MCSACRCCSLTGPPNAPAVFYGVLCEVFFQVFFKVFPPGHVVRVSAQVTAVDKGVSGRRRVQRHQLVHVQASFASRRYRSDVTE